MRDHFSGSVSSCGTGPEVWFSADLASFQFSSASAPYGVLLDFLRDAGVIDLSAEKRLPVLNFDLRYPVLGAEIASACSTDLETSADQADTVALEGAVLPPMVIVADDFGLDAPTTTGILQAFEEGLISATSLLANMPGFDEAVAAAHDRRLHGAVGSMNPRKANR